MQDLIVYIIVLLCIAYAGKHFLKFFNKKSRPSSPCGGGCPGCSLSDKVACNNKETLKNR